MKAGTSTTGKKIFRRRDAHKDAPAMEWFSDLSGKTARLTSIGGRSLLVENHRGILEFSDTCIRLASGCGTIEVRGKNLSINEMRRDALIIRGEIRQMELPSPAGGNDEV